MSKSAARSLSEARGRFELASSRPQRSQPQTSRYARAGRQLVVSLAAGPEGQRLREVLDQAASRAGKPTTVWARETLLAAAGDPQSEGPVDPIVEVVLGGIQATLDLRAVGAMQHRPNKLDVFLGSEWVEVRTSKPQELIDHWKRVRRWGLV